MKRIIIPVIMFIVGILLYIRSKNPFKRCPHKMKPLHDNWKVIANEAAFLPLHIIDSDVNYRVQEDWLGDGGLKKMSEQFKEKTGWIYGWQADVGGPNREWMNWGLVFDGKPCGKNADMCPHTTDLLMSIPGIQVAGFSLMMPRSKINPHTDATGRKFDSMAYHLGLDCPEGCNMIIGDSVISEHNGKAFIFDATDEHWAENKSDKPRMILYIDYKV